MKICVVRLSALGDVIMTLPLIRTLQKNFPEASITWVVSKPFDQILKHLEGVEVVPVKKIQGIRDYFKYHKMFSKRSFDVMLGCQASTPAHLFYTLIRATRKIGFDRKRGKDGHGLFVSERIKFRNEHTLAGIMSFAKYLGAKEMVFDGGVPIADSDREFVRKEFGSDPYFVVHPCASREERNWSEERLKKVIKLISKKSSMRCAITGGRQDRDLCKELLSDQELKTVDFVGKTSLTEMAALIKGAKFVIAPDTGPLHIASGYQKPLIGLFSASNPVETGPYFDRTLVVDCYPKALRKFMGVENPNLVWNKRIYKAGVMDLVSVDAVLERVNKVLV